MVDTRRVSEASNEPRPSFLEQDTERSMGSQIRSFVKTLSRRISARIKGPPELGQDDEDD